MNILGIDLEHPLMNAAGTCRSVESAKKLSLSPVAAVIVGSITLEPRDGNSGDVFWSGQNYAINALGLPNGGATYYRKNLPILSSILHDKGKPLFVSVAGFNPSEYGILAELAFSGGADLVELNLSCPNVWGDGVQKPIASFVPDLISEIILSVDEKVGKEARIAVKVSPFSNPLQLEEVGRLIANSPLVKAVTTTNTFPNVYLSDEKGVSRISGIHFGGLSGPAMKPIGLGQVMQWRAQLGSGTLIFGVGGVTNGQDMLDYLRCGASLVQVATAYLQSEDNNIFSRILSQFVDLDEE